MMTRPCVVALLGVALLCGLVAAQSPSAGNTTAPQPGDAASSTPKQMQNATSTTEAATDPSAEPEPEPESEPEPEPDTEDTKAKSEASFSNDENNGAALMSVSLPSLVLAAVLAKVYAH